MTAGELRVALRVVTSEINRVLRLTGDHPLRAADVTPTLQRITDRVRTAPADHVFTWDPCWFDGEATWEKLTAAAGGAVLHAACLAQQLDRAEKDAAGLIMAVRSCPHDDTNWVMTMTEEGGDPLMKSANTG